MRIISLYTTKRHVPLLKGATIIPANDHKSSNKTVESNNAYAAPLTIMVVKKQF